MYCYSVDGLETQPAFESELLRGWSVRRGRRKRLAVPKKGRAAIFAEIQGQGKEVLRGRSACKRSRQSIGLRHGDFCNKAASRLARRAPIKKCRQELHRRTSADMQVFQQDILFQDAILVDGEIIHYIGEGGLEKDVPALDSLHDSRRVWSDSPLKGVRDTVMDPEKHMDQSESRRDKNMPIRWELAILKADLAAKQYFASVLASRTVQASHVSPKCDSFASKARHSVCVASLAGSIVIDEVEFEPDESVLSLHDRVNTALFEPHILISPHGKLLHLAHGASGCLTVEEFGIVHGDMLVAIVPDKPLNRQQLLYRNARALKGLLHDEELLSKVARQQFKRLGGTLQAGLQEHTCRMFFDDLCAHHSAALCFRDSKEIQGFMKATSAELNTDEFKTFLRLSLLDVVSELDQEAWLCGDVWLNGLF